MNASQYISKASDRTMRSTFEDIYGVLPTPPTGQIHNQQPYLFHDRHFDPQLINHFSSLVKSTSNICMALGLETFPSLVLSFSANLGRYYIPISDVIPSFVTALFFPQGHIIATRQISLHYALHLDHPIMDWSCTATVCNNPLKCFPDTLFLPE